MRMMIRFIDGSVCLGPTPFNPESGDQIPLILEDEISVLQFIGFTSNGRTVVFKEIRRKKEIQSCKHFICDCLKDDLHRARQAVVNLQELSICLVDTMREKAPDKSLEILNSVIENNVYARDAWASLNGEVK